MIILFWNFYSKSYGNLENLSLYKLRNHFTEMSKNLFSSIHIFIKESNNFKEMFIKFSIFSKFLEINRTDAVT